MSRFFLTILIFSLFYSFSSFAQKSESNPYVIEGIRANAIGDDPSKARDIALRKAKREAVEVLLNRLNYPVEIADELDEVDIFKMIRSQQIDNEEIVGNQYIATLNIVFSQDFVDDVMEKNNFKIITDINVRPFLLFLAEDKDGEIILWEQENSWAKAVKNNIKQDFKNPIVIPEANIDNVRIINSSNLKKIDYQNIEPIYARYGVDSSYITIFSYDKDLNEIYIDITYIRGLQNKAIKLKFVNTDFLEKDELIDIVAKKTVSYLISLNSSYIQDQVSYEKVLAVPISSFGNYLMIKNKIEKSGILNSMKLNVVSKNYFLISANFKDDEKMVANDFKKIGLTLEKKSPNYYTLTHKIDNEI